MKKYKKVIFRFNVKAYAVILLPALVLGIYYSNMPLVRPSVNAANINMEFSEDNDSSMTVYEKYIKQIDILNADEWEKMSRAQKIDVLQILVNVETTYLGINPTKICSEKLNARIGEYNYRKKLIRIDYEHLKSAPLEDCIGTVYHEVRHAYQDFIIDTIDWNSKEVRTSVFYSEVREWKKEKETYIDTTKDFDKYYCQKQEQDAREYASERCALMVNYIKNSKKSDLISSSGN